MMWGRKSKRKNDELSSKKQWIFFIALVALMFILTASIYASLEKKVPYTASDYYSEASIAYDAEDYDRAIELFSSAIELNPDDYRFYNDRGHSSYSLDRVDEAIKDYDKTLELNPYYTLTYANLAQAYIALEDYDRAIAYTTEAIELDPERETAYISYVYNNRGYAYAKLEDYDTALVDYNIALEISTHAFTYNNRAYANFHLGNMDTVFEDYARSIELDSNNPEVFRNRAITYYALGSEYYEEALADYARCQELDGEMEAFMLEQIAEMQAYLDNQED